MREVKRYTEEQLQGLVQAAEQLVSGVVTEADRTISPYRKSAFARFPLLFTMSGALGAAMFFYGFNTFLDTVPSVFEHPIVVMVAGFLLLIATGTVYKRLS